MFVFVFLLFFSLRVCNVSGLACTAFVHADSAFRVLVFMRVFSCLCAFLLTPWPSTCCFFVGAVCSYFCFVRLKCKWAWLLILFALTLCCAFLCWFRRVSFWVIVMSGYSDCHVNHRHSWRCFVRLPDTHRLHAQEHRQLVRDVVGGRGRHGLHYPHALPLCLHSRTQEPNASARVRKHT